MAEAVRVRLMVAPDENGFCPFWGFDAHESGREHHSCDVVAYVKPLNGTGVSVCQVPQEGFTLAVCKCECTTCKRAWEADGRPLLRDGKVVRR